MTITDFILYGAMAAFVASTVWIAITDRSQRGRSKLGSVAHQLHGPYRRRR